MSFSSHFSAINVYCVQSFPMHKFNAPFGSSEVFIFPFYAFLFLLFFPILIQDFYFYGFFLFHFSETHRNQLSFLHHFDVFFPFKTDQKVKKLSFLQRNSKLNQAIIQHNI